MYTDMNKDCHNPRIDRAIALHKMIRLFTLGGANEAAALGMEREVLARELTPREAEVLRRRYGLDGHLPQTQRQVAAHYGISRSYVSRIEKKALHKLEEALRDRR